MVARSLLQLDKVIVYESGGHLYKLHLPRESAVIPPIRNQGRNCVAPALIIYFDDEGIVCVSNQIGYLEIERREAAFVPADLLPIKIDIRQIIDCPKINKETGIFLSSIIKGFLIPDGSFVEQQTLSLSIPISRHL